MHFLQNQHLDRQRHRSRVGMSHFGHLLLLFKGCMLFILSGIFSKCSPNYHTKDPPSVHGTINWTLSSSLSPSLQFSQIHFLRLQPFQICRQTFHVKNFIASTLILLLAGDISTNPGPGHGNGFPPSGLAALKFQKDHFPPFSSW